MPTPEIKVFLDGRLLFGVALLPYREENGSPSARFLDPPYQGGIGVPPPLSRGN